VGWNRKRSDRKEQEDEVALNIKLMWEGTKISLLARTGRQDYKEQEKI
jgi:hypothetical protein